MNISQAMLLLTWENVPHNKEGPLPIPQVPITLMNVWYGRTEGIMAPLPFYDI